jgi:hypothetical protein
MKRLNYEPPRRQVRQAFSNQFLGVLRVMAVPDLLNDFREFTKERGAQPLYPYKNSVTVLYAKGQHIEHHRT